MTPKACKLQNVCMVVNAVVHLSIKLWRIMRCGFHATTSVKKPLGCRTITPCSDQAWVGMAWSCLLWFSLLRTFRNGPNCNDWCLLTPGIYCCTTTLVRPLKFKRKSVFLSWILLSLPTTVLPRFGHKRFSFTAIFKTGKLFNDDKEVKTPLSYCFCHKRTLIFQYAFPFS